MAKSKMNPKQKVLGKNCPEFRVSYPSVFEPTSFEDGPETYGFTMLLKKKQDISALKNAARVAAVEKWGKDEKKWPKGKMWKWPFRDGDEEYPDRPEYKGMIFVKASSIKKRKVAAPNKEELESEQDFYAGCYAKAALIAVNFDRAGNKGVAFRFTAVQKTRDGEPFGGTVDLDEEFDDESDSGGGDDEEDYSSDSDSDDDEGGF